MIEITPMRFMWYCVKVGAVYLLIQLIRFYISSYRDERQPVAQTDIFLQHLDDMPSDVDPSFSIPRQAGYLANIVRSELMLDRKAADVRVVKQFLLNYMRQKNWREIDIANVIHHAVRLSFVPSRREIEARTLLASGSVHDRIVLGDSVLEVNNRDNGLFGFIHYLWRGGNVQEPSFSR